MSLHAKPKPPTDKGKCLLQKSFVKGLNPLPSLLSNASRSVEKASPLFPTPKGTVFVRHFCPPLEPTSSNRTHSCRSFFSQQLRPKRTSPVVLLATATVDHYCLTTPNAITRRASRRSPRSSHRTFIIADHMNVIAVS